MSLDLTQKITDNLRQLKCPRANCLSQNRDQLEVVWFGKQYKADKGMTCSSCFLCNEEVVKTAMPLSLNIYPVSTFVGKFVDEMKKFENKQKSEDNFTKTLKESMKKVIAGSEETERYVNETLKRLLQSLLQLAKKMEEYYNKLYKFLLFDEIIELNTDGKTGELLEKIQRVILTLESCKGDDDGYYFDDPATKKYKIQQLNDRISKITYKTVMLLSELYKDLKQQNQAILKI